MSTLLLLFANNFEYEPLPDPEPNPDPLPVFADSSEIYKVGGFTCKIQGVKATVHGRYINSPGSRSRAILPAVTACTLVIGGRMLPG